MKHLKNLAGILFLISFASCDSGNNNEGPPKDSVSSVIKDTTGLNANNKKIKTSNEEEQIKLKLTTAEEKKIMPPLGLTYQELQQNLPELQPVKVEDKEKQNGRNMSKSAAKIVILDKTINAEFHFRNDSLVKCSYLVNELDYNQADRFYKGLQSFYSSRLGECNEAKVEEENHYNRSCNWVVKDSRAELNFDINKSIITWGIEKNK